MCGGDIGRAFGWDQRKKGGGMTNEQEESLRLQRQAAARHDAIVSIQRREADEFRKRLPLMENQMQEAVTQASRQNLMQALTGNNVDMNRRGLLHSRARDMREAEMRAEAGAGLAGARADISTRLRNQSRQMDQYAAQGALGQTQAAQDVEDQVYRNALARVQLRNQNRQLMSQAGTMLGGIPGGLIAGQGGGF